MKFAIGLDVGGTKILAVALDETGRVQVSHRTETPARAGAAAVLESLQRAAEAVIGELPPLGQAGLQGVGVSAAGQIDVARGVVAYASPNIEGWTGTPVADVLRERLGLPIVVENDANAAAFGEWACGAAQGVASVVMVTIGTGVGGGVILDGRVWRGGRWRGGELGHMVVQARGWPCNCGQTGCLEVYASGTAIARLAREARAGWEGAAPAVFQAASDGDPVMQGLLEDSARYLAQGLVSVSSLLDPDLFILGGGVAAQPTYLPLVQRALERADVSGQRGFEVDRVRLASLGEMAGAIGAAQLALRGHP
ncbi:MAG: ROK family protein [Candidatus Sericytochromatia bacterium]|nr:ROK family protein [Candidatus Sericytochromatia bacterium]